MHSIVEQRLDNKRKEKEEEQKSMPMSRVTKYKKNRHVGTIVQVLGLELCDLQNKTTTMTPKKKKTIPSEYGERNTPPLLRRQINTHTLSPWKTKSGTQTWEADTQGASCASIFIAKQLWSLFTNVKKSSLACATTDVDPNRTEDDASWASWTVLNGRHEPGHSQQILLPNTNKCKQTECAFLSILSKKRKRGVPSTPFPRNSQIPAHHLIHRLFNCSIVQLLLCKLKCHWRYFLIPSWLFLSLRWMSGAVMQCRTMEKGIEQGPQ